MSVHSRSSSEVEQVHVGEVLPVFIKEFINDFHFIDVIEELRPILSPHDYQSILDEPNEKRQNLRLFHLMRGDKYIAEKFLKGISFYYNWLTKKAETEHKKPSNNTEIYLNEYRALRRINQEHTDYNVLRIVPYFDLRRKLLKATPSKPYVVLRGDFGSGKKWLARDVCTEFSVMEAMNFKIVMLDVGECQSQEKDLLMLQKLRILMNISTQYSVGENWDISNRILDVQQDIKCKLDTHEYNNCLLVLENVKNKRTLKAFNLGCKMLIITRSKKVSQSLSNAMTAHLEIDNSLTQSEFFCLFEKYLQCSRDKFPKDAIQLYQCSDQSPRLLGFIAQSMRKKSKIIWHEWITNLKEKDIPNNKYAHAVEQTLKDLNEEDFKLYAMLVIFPHDIHIPLELLAAIWNLTLLRAEDKLDVFDKHAFAFKHFAEDGITITCTLPYSYSSYLINSNRIKNLHDSTELHRKVVAFYSITQNYDEHTKMEYSSKKYDLYFYKSIGYHLCNAEMYNVFNILYLDYEFLEQKIRNVGLLQTICDLKHFANKINMDSRRSKFLKALCNFLPKVEEKLVHARDTGLLQYALMDNDVIFDEAARQIQKFPDKIWFIERGNFHQRNLISNLPQEAKIVKFLEPDVCLIVLVNNKMLLADISLECSNNGPRYLTSELSPKSHIVSARLIRNDQYILTLHSNGNLNLWPVAEEHKILKYRHSSKQNVNPINFPQPTKLQATKSKQCIDQQMKGVLGRIVSFDIEQYETYQNETYLHIAYENSKVSVFKWQNNVQEFELDGTPTLQTDMPDIRYICKLGHKYYMILSATGGISFWNLRDSSKLEFSFAWPKQPKSLISCEVYDNDMQILFIFADKVLNLKLLSVNVGIMAGDLQTIYEIDGSEGFITCAKLSPDQRYLILGTNRGLIVYDMQARSEILCSNVSEAIACVDICKQSDPVYKYIIVCGPKNKNTLNLFALRAVDEKTVVWAHNVAQPRNNNSNDIQLEPTVWLLGGNLFDISYNGGTYLLAADSKRRVHQVCIKTKKHWSLLMPTESSHAITAITTYAKNSFVGYQNGGIFNMTEEIYEPAFTQNSISYLRLIDDRILIACAEDVPITCFTDLSSEQRQTEDFNTKYCFKLFAQYLILVNEYGCIMLVDADENFKKVFAPDKQKHVSSKLCGCDFQNDTLFLLTAIGNLYIYKFAFDTLCKAPPLYYVLPLDAINATCLAAVRCANLIAIGYVNGVIRLWKVEPNIATLVFHTKSSDAPINEIKFAPQGDKFVSCSDQLCWWSVAHMINNPLTPNVEKRRSTRFSSQNSSELEGVEEIDAVMLPNNNVAKNTDPWQNKRGPAYKPELLACIKLDGNKAQKIYANSEFTQFNTIDNAGVFYHLEVCTDISKLLHTDDDLAASNNVTHI